MTDEAMELELEIVKSQHQLLNTQYKALLTQVKVIEQLLKDILNKDDGK